MDNLASILELGLLQNISKDNKCFDWCKNEVYMFDNIENKDKIYSLYEITIPYRIINVEDIKDLSIKNVILCIDCTKLDKDKFGIDDMMDIKNGEIISYTYNCDIKPEYISVETYMEKVYTKKGVRRDSGRT